MSAGMADLVQADRSIRTREKSSASSEINSSDRAMARTRTGVSRVRACELGWGWLAPDLDRPREGSDEGTTAPHLGGWDEASGCGMGCVLGAWATRRRCATAAPEPSKPRLGSGTTGSLWRVGDSPCIRQRGQGDLQDHRCAVQREDGCGERPEPCIARTGGLSCRQLL
jgi:hypothetical protein